MVSFSFYASIEQILLRGFSQNFSSSSISNTFRVMAAVALLKISAALLEGDILRNTANFGGFRPFLPPSHGNFCLKSSSKCSSRQAASYRIFKIFENSIFFAKKNVKVWVGGVCVGTACLHRFTHTTTTLHTLSPFNRRGIHLKQHSEVRLLQCFKETMMKNKKEE